MFKTLTEVKIANRSHGNCWFSKDTMRFFNSCIESRLIAGRYFISSERMELALPKQYSVRFVDDNGCISTVGAFQGYPTKKSAQTAIARMNRALESI